MSCTHTHRHAVFGKNDRVGLHELRYAPGKKHVLELLSGGLFLRDHAKRFFGDNLQIGRLHQKAAPHTLEFIVVVVFAHFDCEESQIGFLFQNSERAFIESRRHDDFCKLLGNHFSASGGDRRIKGQDAAKSTLGIGLKGLGVSFGTVSAHSYAAGIGVLDDDAGRFLELTHGFPSCIAIGNIVVRESLAVQLLVACK